MIKNCHMRHENGNCLPAGGFCTANKNICEALHNAYELGRESAQPEQKKYANMSGEEFEEWLKKHGICNPDIHEEIPCQVVPLLIDDAINELPSAQPEERTEKRTEKHACDLISRQAVLDLAKDLKFDNVEGLKHYRYRCIDPDDVRELKSVQLTEAIPVAWIEEEIAILKAKGNELAPMLMSAILSSELDNWKERLKNDNS